MNACPGSPMVVLAGLLVVTPACAQTPAASSQTQAPTDVAARVAGRSITVEELDKKWQELDAGSYMKATQEQFDMRRRVLEVLIGDMLIADEAEKRGVSVDQLLEAELPARISEVTDADLQAAYRQMRSQLNNATLDQVRVPLTQFLQRQRRAEAREALVSDLKATAGTVEVLLDPPRYTVESAGHDPVWGPAAAPVEIVEFSDFQCPYCGRVTPTIQRIRETFGDQVKVVFRDFPLTAIHPQAMGAAEAAECAREQGKFWEYHDRLFANQRALMPEDLKRYADEVGMDVGKLDACLAAGQARARVEEDLQAAQDLGLSATPAFFINGRHVSGAQPYEVFEAIIREELARAGR